MGFRLATLFVAAALTTVPAQALDEISWVRTDGASGWSTQVPRVAQKDSTPASPLLAPVWFPKLPDEKIPLSPSGTFDLASARGKVLLIDYWASWCAPCQIELPLLQRLYAARRGDGLLAVAVNVDEGVAVASETSKRLGLTMMVGLNHPALYRALGVRSLPTLVVIDKQGRVRARWNGYHPGLEKELSAIVDKLLAGDDSGTTREVASVTSGEGLLRVRWSRELPGSADGVAGLPAGVDGGARVVVSGGDELVSFDASGETVARLKVAKMTGRLLDFGVSGDGARELVGFRPGATSVGVVALRSGNERAIALPAPLLDLAQGAGDGADRRLVIATMRGAAQALAREDRAKLLEGREGVRSVAVNPARDVVALSAGGAIGALDAAAPAEAHVAEGDKRLLAAREAGVVIGPRSTIAAVSGKFLPGEGRQLAVATFASRLLLLDEASGRVLLEASWAGIRDLGATDLDGDGRDELLVAAGRAVTALGAASH